MPASQLQSFEHEKTNKQIESYRKVSASGKQALLHHCRNYLKTVERLLVDSKNTASEANEWGDDLNQPYNLASFREFRNNSDDAQWLYRRLSSSAWLLIKPWNYLSQKWHESYKTSARWSFANEIPHCEISYTALHICSVATTFLFLLKENQGSISEEYHPCPSKRWRDLPTAASIMVVTVNGLKTKFNSGYVKIRNEDSALKNSSASTMQYHATFFSGRRIVQITPSLMPLDHRQTQ